MKWRGLLTLLLCASAVQAQQGPIDPTWVYVTPLRWTSPPKDLHPPYASARIVILYPEGQYAELGAVLIRLDNSKRVTFKIDDGLVIRHGTWARTDDRAVRIHGQDVYRDVPIVYPSGCGGSTKDCDTHTGSATDDNCALEGSSKTHLAQTIHCRRLSVSPLALNLDLEQLAALLYPFLHADRIKTPTLFMGGDKDMNVPLEGGEQMYEALRSVGTPAELIVYPGQFHGFTGPSFIRDRYVRWFGWYDRYVQGKEPTPFAPARTSP